MGAPETVVPEVPETSVVMDSVSAVFRIDDAVRAVQTIHGGRRGRARFREHRAPVEAGAAAVPAAPSTS